MNIRSTLTKEDIQKLIDDLKDKDDELVEMILEGIPGHPITLEDVKKSRE